MEGKDFLSVKESACIISTIQRRNEFPTPAGVAGTSESFLNALSRPSAVNVKAMSLLL